MMERIAGASPRPRARITGVVYLLYFLTAISAVLFVKGLVVSGDAAATANNILAHEPSFRLGFAVGLIGTALYIALTVLFYDLFKPVNSRVSLLAAFAASWDARFRLSAASFNLPLWSSWEAVQT